MPLPSSSPDPATPVLYSAAERYLRHATRVLGQRFPGAALEEIGPDVGRIESSGRGIAEVAAACRDVGGEGPPVAYVRHLAREDVLVPPEERDRVPSVAVEIISGGVTGTGRPAEAARDDLALQVWSSGPGAGRAPELREAVVAALADVGVEPARGGRPFVLTVCSTASGTSLGLSRRDEALADWPGGRVILGRPPEQVSRAEWKLEELLKLHDVLPDLEGGDGPCRALDLGAAPGGWARILRARGCEVWAIDPGDLHPSVTRDPGIHHERTTAGRFLAAPGEAFDLVVNDMRMVADRSCRVMVDAAARLRPGGTAVVTLKVGTERPAAVVERALRVLRRAYDLTFVRQLYHNKNEVTAVGSRR